MMYLKTDVKKLTGKLALYWGFITCWILKTLGLHCFFFLALSIWFLSITTAVIIVNDLKHTGVQSLFGEVSNYN